MITAILFSFLLVLAVVTAIVYRDYIVYTPGLILGVSAMWLLNGAIAYYYPSTFQALAVVNIPCQLGLIFVKGEIVKCLHF